MNNSTQFNQEQFQIMLRATLTNTLQGFGLTRLEAVATCVAIKKDEYLPLLQWLKKENPSELKIKERISVLARENHP